MARSPPGSIFWRPAHLTVGVPNYPFGLDRKYLLVAHLDDDGLPAVQAGSINANRFAGNEPAYR